MNAQALRKKADKYRRDRQHVGGVVVMHDGHVAGWMDTLRNPERWEPCCIAVNAEGSLFEARGGNAYNGATEWAPIITEGVAA